MNHLDEYDSELDSNSNSNNEIIQQIPESDSESNSNSNNEIIQQIPESESEEVLPNLVITIPNNYNLDESESEFMDEDYDNEYIVNSPLIPLIPLLNSSLNTASYFADTIIEYNINDILNMIPINNIFRLSFLTDINYFSHYDEILLDDIEDLRNQMSPLIDIQEYYRLLIINLLNIEYDYEQIYYGLGITLLISNDIPPNINVETIMNIIRYHIVRLYNLGSNVNNELEPVTLTVSQTELDKIPITPFNSLDDETKNHYEKCTICRCEYDETDNVRILKCSHLFHPECIDIWLLNNSYKCPICRSEVADFIVNL